MVYHLKYPVTEASSSSSTPLTTPEKAQTITPKTVPAIEEGLLNKMSVEELVAERVRLCNFHAEIQDKIDAQIAMYTMAVNES